MPIREQLLGAWELVSYVEQPVDGAAPSYPFGEDAVGLLLYTADGYMSAQLMRANRTSFTSGDWFQGTAEEYRDEASTYIAYSGPFEIEEDGRALRHSV